MFSVSERKWYEQRIEQSFSYCPNRIKNYKFGFSWQAEEARIEQSLHRIEIDHVIVDNSSKTN